ncbi:hypothetical protein L1987_40284 [Smallanthus sonchifolius]|uniref:Uncharacterized protein n=1 Tax=Smallanthus sonchifolius TaxID=185202 RepID=A0ACB9GSC2_9ASTR|nr:hypothetical protein L1987_40284 [Smallanthus sonchifolius]
MSSANQENAPLPPALPQKEDQIPQPLAPLQPIVSDDEDVQEELDQVQQSEPEEESEEEQVGDAEGVHSDTDSREVVPYSVIHGEDTSSEEVRPPTPYPPQSPNPAPLHNDWVNFMGLTCRRIARKTVLPHKKRALSLPDTEPFPKKHCLSSQREVGESSHQQSEDTSEDSDAIIEALDDHLVRLQGEVGLNGSTLGSLHGRVTIGETRLAAVEQEVVAAGPQDAWTNERLDSFAALTIVNTMLLAFTLLVSDQLQELEPDEESEEEQVGDAKGVHSDTDSGETVPYSVIHREDTSREEVRPPIPSPPRSPSPEPL